MYEEYSAAKLAWLLEQAAALCYTSTLSVAAEVTASWAAAFPAELETAQRTFADACMALWRSAETEEASVQLGHAAIHLAEKLRSLGDVYLAKRAPMPVGVRSVERSSLPGGTRTRFCQKKTYDGVCGAVLEEDGCPQPWFHAH